MVGIKKRSDGRYMINVQTGWTSSGKRKYKSVYGKTQAEVRAAAAKVKENFDSGFMIQESSLTIAQWVPQWLSAYKTDVRDSTQKMYESAVRLHITPKIGNYKLKAVRNHHLQSLLSSMAIDGYSKRTVEIVQRTVGQIFKTAAINGLIEKNPAEGLTVRGAAAVERRALTEFEEEVFLKHFAGKAEWMFPTLLYYTGLRRGEALALTKSDIDIQAQTVTVNKAVTFNENSPVISEPKTSTSVRTVPLPKALIPSLKECLSATSSLLLFPMSNGELRTLSSYRKYWARFFKELNLAAGGTKDINVFSNITAHMFRHNYATKLYSLGVDVKTAQLWLGHKDLKVTMQIYVHLSDKLRIENTAKLDLWQTENS